MQRFVKGTFFFNGFPIAWVIAGICWFVNTAFNVDPTLWLNDTRRIHAYDLAPGGYVFIVPPSHPDTQTQQTKKIHAEGK